MLAIITVFVSAEFRDALFLEKSVWKALFVFGGIASFAWLLYALWRRPQAASIDQLIERLKKGTVLPGVAPNVGDPSAPAAQ